MSLKKWDKALFFCINSGLRVGRILKVVNVNHTSFFTTFDRYTLDPFLLQCFVKYRSGTVNSKTFLGRDFL